jgi:hypothetical protein
MTFDLRYGRPVSEDEMPPTSEQLKEVEDRMRTEAVKKRSSPARGLACAVVGHRFGYNSDQNWRVCYRCALEQTTDKRGEPENWAWQDRN